MDNYIKTIINGLKVWAGSRLTRLEASVSKLSGNLDALGSKITSLTSKVAKAQTTANEAKSAASTAQTTANDAKSAASTAQTTANQAAGQTAYNNGEVLLWNGVIDDGTIKASLPSEKLPNIAQVPLYLITTSASGAVNNITTDTFRISFASIADISPGDVIGISMLGENTYRAFKTGINIFNSGVTSVNGLTGAVELDIPNTAPVVFTDESSVLINADGGAATAEEIYDALLAGVVYVKMNDAYYIVQNFAYQDGGGITIATQDSIGSMGVIKYEVTA